MIKPDENPLDYVDDYVHGLLSPEAAEIVAQYCEQSRLGRVALQEAQRRYDALASYSPSAAGRVDIHRS